MSLPPPPSDPPQRAEPPVTPEPSPSYGSYGSTPPVPPIPSAPSGYGQPTPPAYGQPASGALTTPVPVPAQPAWGQPVGAWGAAATGPSTPAPGSAPRRTSTAGAEAFFAKLFDLSFERFITPSIVKIVYVIAMVAIVLGWLAYAVAAFTQSVLLGLFVLIVVGPIVGLVYLILTRIALEFYLAVIRLAEDVRELKDARSSD